MSSNSGVYVYACPEPIVNPTNPTGSIYADYLMADTHEHADLQKRIAEYQEDISELDRQVAIFMDALRYCISKFSPEDLAKDWRLGMIKIVTENQG